MYLALVLGGISVVVAGDLWGESLAKRARSLLPARYVWDASLLLVILLFGEMTLSSFIYFQF